jgi:hypothetical protein
MATNYNYFGGIVTNGLVLDLDAAKVASYPGTGTSWYDISGNNNNGTLTNGPTFSGIGKQASIVFDGVDDYVSGSGVFLSTQGTITVWFKTSNTYSNNYLLSLPFASANNNGFDLGFSGTTTFRGVLSTTNGFEVITYSTTYSDNNWHMGALTYNGTSVILYYDGVARNSASTTGTIRQQANGEFNIARFGSFGGYVAASVSNATVYNRALSAQEVLQNFNALRGRYGI